MANQWYKKGLEYFGNGVVDWLNDRIKCTAINTALYTADASSHEFIEDVPSASRIGTVTLVGKTNVFGIFDADDLTFANIDAGKIISGLVFWKDTGYENTSPLFFYVDQSDDLPVVGDGDDIEIAFSNDVGKIASL